MLDQNVIKLQHFFEVDMRIKEEMIKMAPPFDNQYTDEESISKYADKVYDSLIYIFSEFKCIAKDIFGVNSLVMEKIIQLESIVKNNFYYCGFDINKLRSFYQKNISDMSIDFLNSVKDECVGYKFSSGCFSVEQANTLNELLHYMHSFVLNSENVLQSIPVISQKENINKEPIIIRGNSCPLFDQLFYSFPVDLDVGITDIVAINERKLLMMVRDRGHALTIEVTINDKIARVEYFIPKLCNIDMINNLPGINRVNENSVGATGVFEIPANELSNSIFDFISKVPTDLDMVYDL